MTVQRLDRGGLQVRVASEELQSGLSIELAGQDPAKVLVLRARS